VTTLLLVPYLPQTSEKLLPALAEESRALSQAELWVRPGGQKIERVPPLFPQDRVLGRRVCT
jgi:methionyl-tRNA synthetase